MSQPHALVHDLNVQDVGQNVFSFYGVEGEVLSEQVEPRRRPIYAGGLSVPVGGTSRSSGSSPCATH
jgi:hypothetical protein